MSKKYCRAIAVAIPLALYRTIMVSEETAQLGSEATRARLQSLIGVGFPNLSEELRAEVAALVAQDVDEWRRTVQARLKADQQSGRYTKRQLSKMVGMHETYVGRAIIDQTKMSEHIIALLSVAVPGYEDVYAEFRRRADQLYLPGGQIPPTTELVEARLVAIARAMHDELPKMQAALDLFKKLSGRVGSDDV